MSESQKFSFGDDAVANAYDNALVPILFKPWALKLIEDYQPWDGLHVLDLATGTGIVAQLLAKEVGPGGMVTGADINGQMLEVARRRCANQSNVEFVECSADSLELTDGCIDRAVCQQGFQFFPDRKKAASEIYRILHNDGIFVATTWCAVEECELFGMICEVLESMGEDEISETMRIPFDFMTTVDLAAPFEASGFVNVEVTRREHDLVVDGGISQAVEMAYATPIGPKLKLLSADQQTLFRKNLAEKVKDLSVDDVTMGRMVSNVLCAQKPS